MLKFFKKLLFLLEIAGGVYLFIASLSFLMITPGFNAVALFMSLIMVFDGLERLDGPEHGRY